MLQKTNIQHRLAKTRSRRISEENLLATVYEIFQKNKEERSVIRQELDTKNGEASNEFTFALLLPENIFHVQDIERLCIEYRLRFLDAHYFKAPIPEEAVSKIRALENAHNITLSNCKVVAPAKLLKLENADDPLLFAPMGNDYFYLIHKWGNDLHPLRKLLMWPYRNFESLLTAILIVSIVFTAMVPMQAFTKGAVSNQEYVLMFLFMFKAVGGIVLFYGFAKGKNFNSAIWNSNYYNA